MNYKEYFKKENLVTIKAFLEFVTNNFNYGWQDQKGKIHNGVNNGASYYLQSPEELLKSHIGICWDITELCRTFFEEMTSLKIETYYLMYADSAGCPCHTILVFYRNDKVYWFEPMMQNFHNGIFEYSSIDYLLEDFVNYFVQYLGNTIEKNNLQLYKYTKPRYHINGFEMRNHIDASTKIERKVKN